MCFLDGDPSNYLTYYKRGTVFLALGKAKQALQDWDKVLKLNSDFTPVRLQRAHVLLKQAEFTEAASEYNYVLKIENNHQEALDGLEKIQQAIDDYEEAKLSIQYKDYDKGIEYLTRAIETCPWAVELREMRAELYVHGGDEINAISDVRFTTKLMSDNTIGYFKLSSMLYRLGNIEDSLKYVFYFNFFSYLI